MSNPRNQESENGNELFDDASSDSTGDSASSSREEDGGEDQVMQWLLALDFQVIGACRADERLKPLLKLTASTGAAEDRLLSHLCQNFEPSEVGMLARCFCIPLVSIRVGKINKQGTLLCPASTRGNLNLMVLPTSELRLSVTGDDGSTERLFTIGVKARIAVAVLQIPSDSSGRSFHIKISDGRDFYFWCSEKSKLLGIELFAKMGDILERRPSIADLTGISKSRLDCLATHLHAYLAGSNTRDGLFSSLDSSSSTTSDVSDKTFSISSKSLRARHTSSQQAKANQSYQGSLSPRLSSFKEGLSRNFSSVKNTTREKLRRRGDTHLSVVENLVVTLPLKNDASSSTQSESENQQVKCNAAATSSFLEALGKFEVPPIQSLACSVPSLNPPLLSPYYCWCPQGVPSVQYSSALPQLPSSLAELPQLPPLSSLLSASRSSSLLTPTPPLSLSDLPSLDFPAILPDPLVRLPLPSSQQIPTFTPLMCDPIVHIPVIDVCSSGQGYLVSAGPAIAGTIPPLHRKLVNPMMSEADSVVENGARETLRLLISGSTQANPQLMDVLPTVFNGNDNQSLLVAGSRGMYSGLKDVDAMVNSVATTNSARRSAGDGNEKSLGDAGNSNVLQDNVDKDRNSNSTSEKRTD